MKTARGAGGRSVPEASRDALLSKVKHERSARADAKRDLKAAVIIQKTYRGHAVRQKLHAELLASWLTRYQANAAATAQQLSATVLSEKVVPTILLAYLSPPLASLTQADISSDVSAAVRAGLAQRRINLDVGSAALRGCLSILLRSLAADVHSGNNYLALAGREGPQGQEWLYRTKRLLLLCQLAVGHVAYRDDVLMQVAAAHITRRVLDLQQWPQALKGDHHVQHRVIVLQSMISTSGAACSAAARLVTLLAAPAGGQPHPPQQQQQLQKLLTAEMEIAMLPWTQREKVSGTLAQSGPLDSATGGAAAGRAVGATGPLEAQWLATQLLVIPQLQTTPACSLLSNTALFPDLLAALEALTNSPSTRASVEGGAPPGRGPGKPAGPWLRMHQPWSALQSLHCLCNLAVIAGRANTVRVVNANGKAYECLEPSPLLTDPQVVEQYVRLLRKLLAAAAAQASTATGTLKEAVAQGARVAAAMVPDECD